MKVALFIQRASLVIGAVVATVGAAFLTSSVVGIFWVVGGALFFGVDPFSLDLEWIQLGLLRAVFLFICAGPFFVASEAMEKAYGEPK